MSQVAAASYPWGLVHVALLFLNWVPGDGWWGPGSNQVWVLGGHWGQLLWEQSGSLACSRGHWTVVVEVVVTGAGSCARGRAAGPGSPPSCAW